MASKIKFKLLAFRAASVSCWTRARARLGKEAARFISPIGIGLIGDSFLAVCALTILGTFIWEIFYGLVGLRITLQLIAAVLLVPWGVIIAWRSYRALNANLIARTVSTYVLVAVAFAGCYYTIYYVRPVSYSFSSGILTSSDESRMTELTNQSRLGFRRLGLIQQLRLWLQTQSDDRIASFLRARDQPWKLAENISVTHQTNFVQTPPTVSITYSLIFEDRIGRIVFDGSNNPSELAVVGEMVAGDETKEKYFDSLSQLEGIEIKAITNASNELRTMHPSQSFSLLDFVYFSIIIVTTVGYGDIVPNSTLVRMFVVTQILFGLFLLITASNEGLKKRRPRRTIH